MKLVVSWSDGNASIRSLRDHKTDLHVYERCQLCHAMTLSPIIQTARSFSTKQKCRLLTKSNFPQCVVFPCLASHEVSAHFTVLREVVKCGKVQGAGVRTVIRASIIHARHLYDLDLYTVHCTLNTTLHTVHCTLYTVHCTLYTVHCTLYTVHCTLLVMNDGRSNAYNRSYFKMACF